MTPTPTRQRRPEEPYYEERHPYLSQGDIFRDVPLAFPLPAREIVTEESGSLGTRLFLSGPFDVGFAMLITPTCSMRAQGTAPGTYAHPVRTLAVIRPLKDLCDAKLFDESKVGLLRAYDGLINYMYLPALSEHNFPESVAMLYMPVTLHHDMIAGQRIAQLSLLAAQQLQRKLVHFSSGYIIERERFQPPMD